MPTEQVRESLPVRPTSLDGVLTSEKATMVLSL